MKTKKTLRAFYFNSEDLKVLKVFAVNNDIGMSDIMRMLLERFNVDDGLKIKIVDAIEKSQK